jgi:hypothetical protein
MRQVAIVVLLSSLGVIGCAGTTEEAKAPTAEWSTFTGKYSGPLTKVAENNKAEPAEVAEEAAPPPAASLKAKTAASDEAAAKKASASKATVKGESLSTVTVETLTDATKGAVKQKFVSNGVVTGPEYEVVSVEMKTAKVQVIRPASSPTPNGPSIASPKAKQGSLSKTDAGYYDEEADVLVVVTAAKKGTAQKVLGSIVKK